jgi:hypothetical protein
MDQIPLMVNALLGQVRHFVAHPEEVPKEPVMQVSSSIPVGQEAGGNKAEVGEVSGFVSYRS